MNYNIEEFIRENHIKLSKKEKNKLEEDVFDFSLLKKSLNSKHQDLLFSKYGILGYEKKTSFELAKKYNTTSSSITTTQMNILNKKERCLTNLFIKQLQK